MKRMDVLAEKMRVHILAKELNVTAKAMLDKCAAEGLNVKNHMSTLTAGQEATLREWFSEGTHETTVETSARVDLTTVQAPRRKRKTTEGSALAETEASFEAAEPELLEIVGAAVVVEAEAPESAAAVAVAAAPVTTVVEPPPQEPAPAPREGAAVEAEPPVIEFPAPVVEVAAMAPPAIVDVGAPPASSVLIRPAGPQNVPAPARLRGPRVVRYEAPEPNVFSPSSRRREPTVGAPVVGAPGEVAGHGRGKREVGADKDARKKIPPRRVVRGSEAGEKIQEWRDRDILELQERLKGATGRRIHTRHFELKQAKSAQGPAERKTRAEIQEPVTLRNFCATLGVPFLSVFNILKRDHNLIRTVNSTMDKETAELVALEYGVELVVVEARTSLDILKEEFEKRERPKKAPRPAVVTFLGHVDHGKTSLLDAIRRAKVADGEDGGITQHIGSYHLMTRFGPLTFLDTPGHEAFTAMRARGASMTDIVVLVVAADDGVMPQTVEAISHAKAASVPIVVAMNKVDLGRHKEVEIYGQLSGNGLTPSGTWGGETDVIPTSAITGEGIDQLIEHLVAMGELMGLQADPTVDAIGTVIESETKEGVGPVARVLVQEGTLRKGDVVVCGNAAGKIRALHDDAGQPIESAGPSIPVEIWGLEDVPMAGDRLFQVDSMPQAKQIADEVAHRRLDDARNESRKGRSLEDLFKQRDTDEIPELNVIVKADVDGSVDVLRHSLGELPSDQVRLSFRHSGVGAVNDSDVLLAEASDAIIIAFRVTTQVGARKLAESRRVDVRYYRVVYEVIDEIVKAMEGKLAPEEKLEARGAAEVRQVFKVSRAGMVAGCMVTSGIVARSHTARVVREGIVVREGCLIESLRHFKDDAKEVRAGLECGLRLSGFDDVKPGDTIETYEIVRFARKL